MKVCGGPLNFLALADFAERSQEAIAEPNRLIQLPGQFPPVKEEDFSGWSELALRRALVN